MRNIYCGFKSILEKMRRNGIFMHNSSSVLRILNLKGNIRFVHDDFNTIKIS